MQIGCANHKLKIGLGMYLPARKLNPEPSLTQQMAFLGKRGACVEGRPAQSRGNQSVTEPDHQQGEHRQKEFSVFLKERALVDVTTMRTEGRVRVIRADLSPARFARHEFRRCVVRFHLSHLFCGAGQLNPLQQRLK